MKGRQILIEHSVPVHCSNGSTSTSRISFLRSSKVGAFCVVRHYAVRVRERHVAWVGVNIT